MAYGIGWKVAEHSDETLKLLTQVLIIHRYQKDTNLKELDTYLQCR